MLIGIHHLFPSLSAWGSSPLTNFPVIQPTCGLVGGYPAWWTFTDIAK
jgi:hypothetical protein